MPESGLWTVVAQSTEVDTTVDYGVFVRGDGPLEEAAHLETLLPNSNPNFAATPQPGAPVLVRVFVARNGEPVRGVSWKVSAETPRESTVVIPVFDDGRHADGKANDGISVGAIEADSPDGTYKLQSKGSLPSGVEYIVLGTFEVQAKSDLRIRDSISVTPRAPNSGEPVTLKVTVINDGTVEHKDVTVTLYVTARKRSERQFDLKAGESKEITMGWVPAREGRYSLAISLVSYDEPYWSDFTNNTKEMVVDVK